MSLTDHIVSGQVVEPDMLLLRELLTTSCMAFQVVHVEKNLPASAGDIKDMGLIPGSVRSPGGGNGNPLSYLCLENPMD